MTKTTFKIWATIERTTYHDGSDIPGDEVYEDMHEIPALIGQFATLKEAEAALLALDPEFAPEGGAE